MQIIPKKMPAVETDWQKELANSFTDIFSLLEFLDIDPAKLPRINYDVFKLLNTENEIAVNVHSRARKLFPMRVPKPFANLMQKGKWDDPLLQQVVPNAKEFIDKPNFVTDPLKEQASPIGGLIRKYKSRVLLIVRGGCAVNCRYCFRRHFPYQEHHINRQQYAQILDYIRADSSINEVIFSGGDPLMANDEQLGWLAEQVNNIQHIQRLRIHTRLPVVVPQRINSTFVDWISTLRLKVVMVLHINHANEISHALNEKSRILQQAGVSLLNQSVLLKGINDNASTLENLSEALFNAHILPYYLFLFDPVKGASHFDVSKQEALPIMQELIKRLPGFLVPKLTKEYAGQPGKTPIDLGLEP